MPPHCKEEKILIIQRIFAGRMYNIIMNKKLIVVSGIILLTVLILGIFLIESRIINISGLDSDNDKPLAPGSAVTPPQSSGPISMEEVTKHGSETDCWSAVNGKVYNLTSWINQHPGGSERILGICGIDGSSAFNTQHSGQREPEGYLSSFYIGDLEK